MASPPSGRSGLRTWSWSAEAGRALAIPLVLAGEVVKRQRKTVREASQDEQTEWQLFVGNKERYGLSFRYVDAADIVAQQFSGPGNQYRAAGIRRRHW